MEIEELIRGLDKAIVEQYSEYKQKGVDFLRTLPVWQKLTSPENHLFLCQHIKKIGLQNMNSTAQTSFRAALRDSIYRISSTRG